MTSPQDSEPGRRSRFSALRGRRNIADSTPEPALVAEPAWVPETTSAPATTADPPATPTPELPIAQRAAEQSTSEWLPAGATATIAREERPSGPTPGQWLPGGESVGPELTASQRLAVYAYCHEMCGSQDEGTAAHQAIASLRSSRVISDEKLLRATRLAAAEHASAAPLGTGWRTRMRDALAAEHDVSCRRVPVLLARRRNGDLEKDESVALDEHLHQCLHCQAAEVRLERAERAFAAAVAGTAIEEVETAATGSFPVSEEPPAAAARTEKWEAIASAAVPLAAVAAGAEAADAEDAVAQPTSSPATPSPAVPPPPRRRRRRLSAVAIALALVAIAVAGAGAAVLLGKGKSSAHHSTLSLATPSISSSTAAPAVRHHPKHKRVVHHAARKPHKSKPKPKPKPTVVASAPAQTTAVAPTTSAVQPSTSVTHVTPTPTPQPTPQPTPTHSVTIQQPSLGATGGSTTGVGPKKK
jgi:hypothetical protein